MWNRIKRWLSGNNDTPPQEAEYDFKWYELGKDNPFGIRVLDVRSLTWSVIATTRDPRIAESFNVQRHTDGREFIDAKIDDSATIKCDLTFPHNGESLEGIVFKADSMDVKWDIYIYDSVFLFVRSWTGQLQYRASADIASDRITIREVESSRNASDTAAQTVKFLLATHAMGRVLPHTISRDTPNDPKMIALMSFSMFGKLGCYATYEDILEVEIPTPTT